MKILVTGAAGMFGRELASRLARRHAVVPLDRRALDVTDATTTRAVIGATRPDWVVHCAAYTKVDRAEAEPDRAHAVNADGTHNVAVAARAIAARVAYVSTDYVFDGSARRPLRETDPTAPVNVYGSSKLAGEIAVRDVLPDAHLVIRTQWLFGPGGQNFIDTALAKAAHGEPLDVVDDQTGSPSYTRDVAAALATLIASDARGIVHIANGGEATWFELARYVIGRAGLAAAVRPCSSEEMGRPARRPPYSVLDCSRLASLSGAPLRPWREALDDFLRESGVAARLAPRAARGA